MRKLLIVPFFAGCLMGQITTYPQAGGGAAPVLVTAVCDGATDDTTAFNTALAAAAYIIVPSSTSGCVVSNLTIAHDSTIQGLGIGASKLIFKAASTGTMLDASTPGFALRVEHLELDGGNNSNQSGTGSPGSRTAVLLNADQPSSGVLDISVHGFTNIAVGLNGAGSPPLSSVDITDLRAYYNYTAIDTGVTTAGEYASVKGLIASQNRYGIRIASGNDIVSASHIDGNGIGVLFTSSATTANGMHGSITGSSINHNATGTIVCVSQNTNTTALTAAFGYEITGNNIWFGPTTLVGCVGLDIAHNIFGSGMSFELIGGSSNRFRSNWFYQTPTSFAFDSAWVATENWDAQAGGYLLGNGYAVNGGYVSTTANLVVNGDFGSGVSWTAGSGWTIGAGVATCSNCALLSQVIGATSGLGGLYTVTLTIGSYSAGSLGVCVGGGLCTATQTGNGTKTYTLPISTDTSNNGTLYLQGAGGGSFTVDNVSATITSTDGTKRSIQVSGYLLGLSAAPSVNATSCTGATIGTGATNLAGTITGLPVGACSVKLTFSNATAPTGFSCAVSDRTTGNLFRVSTSDTTSVTFSGTSGSGDVLSYGPCGAY